MDNPLLFVSSIFMILLRKIHYVGKTNTVMTGAVCSNCVILLHNVRLCLSLNFILFKFVSEQTWLIKSMSQENRNTNTLRNFLFPDWSKIILLKGE